MEVFFSRDEDEIFVTLGAGESILMDEASHAADADGGNTNSPMQLPLKLKYKNPADATTDDRPNGTCLTCPPCGCVLPCNSWLSTRCGTPECPVTPCLRPIRAYHGRHVPISRAAP
jgi:hypothetical protein